MRFTGRQVLTIVFLFIATRALLIAIGTFAVTQLPSTTGEEFKHLLDGGPVFDMWYRWDAGFYATIATDGYKWVNEHRAAEDMVFLPFYPFTIRSVMSVSGCGFSPYLSTCATVSGLIVSNLALLAATFLLFDLARRHYSETTAWYSVGLLMLSPASIYLSGVYTEGLFLFLVLACFCLLERDHFLLAVLVACLAAMTRSVGVALVPALLWFVWTHKTEKWAVIRGLVALLPAAALALYIVSAGLFLGNLTAYFQTYNTTWGRPAGSFIEAFTVYFGDQEVSWVGWWFSWIDLFATLGYLTLAVIVLRVRTAWGLFALFAILIPIASGSLLSMPRFGTVVFPFYIIIGAWLAAGRRPALDLTRRVMVYGASAVLMFFIAIRFVTWKWIA